MKFDYTHGNEAKYMVSAHRWNVSDQYYVDSMKKAKELFEDIKQTNKGDDVSVSIYDLKKDVRKAFARV